MPSSAQPARHVTIVPEVVERLHAALDLEMAEDTERSLPLPWHWIYFVDATPTAKLGRDGLPVHTGVPSEFTRQMWAGSTIHSIQPLLRGQGAFWTSTIVRSRPFASASGLLWLVQTEVTITQHEIVCLIETDNTVYLPSGPRDPVSPQPTRLRFEPEWQAEITPTALQLFRFSALMFNAHRIHYDERYARDDEGHPGLIVNGHLVATLACRHLQQNVRRPLRTLRIETRAPALAGAALTIAGSSAGADHARVDVRRTDGAVVMSLQADLG